MCLPSFLKLSSFETGLIPPWISLACNGVLSLTCALQLGGLPCALLLTTAVDTASDAPSTTVSHSIMPYEWRGVLGRASCIGPLFEEEGTLAVLVDMGLPFCNTVHL